MRNVVTAMIVVLSATHAWAGEKPRPVPMGPEPAVLDPSQLDQVTAGDRHDTPFYFIIINNQRALDRLGHALTRRSAGTAPSAMREHVLLARQVGLSVPD